MTPLATLQLRLKQLGYEGPLETADECRAAVIATMSAEAVCERFPTAKGVKLLKFGQAFEIAWGQKWETRERVARRQTG